jgi:hypothetical protein
VNLPHRLLHCTPSPPILISLPASTPPFPLHYPRGRAAPRRRASPSCQPRLPLRGYPHLPALLLFTPIVTASHPVRPPWPPPHSHRRRGRDLLRGCHGAHPLLDLLPRRRIDVPTLAKGVDLLDPIVIVVLCATSVLAISYACCRRADGLRFAGPQAARMEVSSVMRVAVW